MCQRNSELPTFFGSVQKEMVGEMRRLGLIVVPALLFVLLFAPPAGAVPYSAGGETTKPVVGTQGASPFRCVLTLSAMFSGVKNLNTGVISGTWSYSAGTTCNIQMLTLRVRAWLRKSIDLSTTADECSLSQGSCKAVFAAASLYCAPCNGTWSARSDHFMRFPFAPIIATPPGCTRFVDEIDCILNTGPIVLA